MSQVPALAQVFRNMGFSWSTADDWTTAIDRANVADLSSDDLAAAILRYCRQQTARRLAGCRQKARETFIGDGTSRTVADVAGECLNVDEDPDQLDLFATADERQRFMQVHPATKGR